MGKLNNNSERIIMPSEEARKMFGVSKRTWAIWREKKLLNYAKIGQLIFYKIDDIKEFIENHSIKKTMIANYIMRKKRMMKAI